MARLTAWTVAAFALVVGVLWLRSATMTVTVRHPSDSWTEIVLDVDTLDAPSAVDAPAALFAACHSRISNRVVPGSWEELEGGRYRVALQPALGTFARRELVGCLEDRTLDHVQATVERIEHHGTG